MMEIYCSKLVDCVLVADRITASKLLDYCTELYGVEFCIHSIFEPVLHRIGEMWEKSNNISLSQAYVAAKISEDFILKNSDKFESQFKFSEKRPAIILGNIEDDFHALGRKMVGIFLKTAGWKIIDLGNDVVAEKFVQAAIDNEACIIGASAMMYSTAKNIGKLREEIDKNNLNNKIKLAVGGAVFKLREDLITEVGGDGTVSNAIKTPELFEELYQQTLA